MSDTTAAGIPAVHEGHMSAGSQITKDASNIIPIDMAAETAKFDNAFGAIPGAVSPMAAMSGGTGTSTSHTNDQKEVAKDVAGSKKEEYKERHAQGESITDIAKNEKADADKAGEHATPDGHKPGFMEKIKAKLHKDSN